MKRGMQWNEIESIVEENQCNFEVVAFVSECVMQICKRNARDKNNLVNLWFRKNVSYPIQCPIN